MDVHDAGTAIPSARIDRWLFGVRLFKSRSLAARAVSGGRVHINGSRVKPAHAIHPGDRVSFVRNGVEFDCAVVTLPVRRGPAPEAARCYQESEPSLARRTDPAVRGRAAALLAPRPEQRPDKHQRRDLRRLRGRD